MGGTVHVMLGNDDRDKSHLTKPKYLNAVSCPVKGLVYLNNIYFEIELNQFELLMNKNMLNINIHI